MISKETLFALSLFPYLGFLWFFTRSGKAPRLALIGFYMTLVFVAVTIPASGKQLFNTDAHLRKLTSGLLCELAYISLPVD